MVKRIAIYGGAFSPPHIGHASVIEAVLRLFACDELWVMPSADRHDKVVSASGSHRVKMLNIMLKELFPNSKIPVIVSDIELKRGQPIVTYETQKIIKEKYQDHEFHFVLGSENLSTIETKWVNGKKLFQETNFVAVRNPLLLLSEKLPPHLFIIDDIPWTNASSTFVRRIISEGHSGLPYITSSVARYIKENSLYK